MILNSLALELQMGLIHQSLMVMIDRSVEYVILVSVIVLAMLSPPSGSVLYLCMHSCSGCRSEWRMYHVVIT